jgi:hypothetical protein
MRGLRIRQRRCAAAAAAAAAVCAFSTSLLAC